MKKFNAFLLIFTFLFGIFATNLQAMKRDKPDTKTSKTSEETNRYSKQPRKFLHGLRTFFHQDQTNHFDKLPDELLLKIFTDLNPTKEELINSSKVSKRFHNISLDSSLINPEIQKYKQLLNSVINFDATTNSLNLDFLNSYDRVKALLGFKFLIQIRDKNIFLKYLGIDFQTFCESQYKALINFFKSFKDYLNTLPIDATLETSMLEKSIFGIDAPYNINLIFIYKQLIKELEKTNNILININNLACGETPLIIASKLYLIKSINISLIRVLLLLNANVNTKSIWQNTALHFALNNNLPELAILFLENKNTDFRIKNNFGETALELAAKLNNQEINKILIPKLTWYEKQLFNFTIFFRPRIV